MLMALLVKNRSIFIKRLTTIAARCWWWVMFPTGKSFSRSAAQPEGKKKSVQEKLFGTFCRHLAKTNHCILLNAMLNMLKPTFVPCILQRNTPWGRSDATPMRHSGTPTQTTVCHRGFTATETLHKPQDFCLWNEASVLLNTTYSYAAKTTWFIMLGFLKAVLDMVNCRFSSTVSLWVVAVCPRFCVLD